MLLTNNDKGLCQLVSVFRQQRGFLEKLSILDAVTNNKELPGILRSSITTRSFSSSTATTNPIRYGVQQFFELLERRYGGTLPMDTGPAAEVIVADTYIQTEHLIRLMNHNASAIHVKNFYCSTGAMELGKQLANDSICGKGQNWKISTTNRGLESSDVITVGEHTPFNIACANKSIDQYFVGVQHELRKRRRRFIKVSSNNTDKGTTTKNGTTAATTIATTTTTKTPLDQNEAPQLWPLDLLRLQLDENWPSGAGLARRYPTSTGTNWLRSYKDDRMGYYDNPPFGGGLARVMHGPTRWKKGYIHVDEMGPLDPKRGLFSANIYLQLPKPPKEGKETEHRKDTITIKTNAALHDNDDDDDNNNNKNNKNNCNDNERTTSTVPLGQELLHIWPLGIRSRWDWYRNAVLLSGLSTQDSISQSMLRAKLGKPISIVANPGDLILLCVQRPHAAVGFTNGVRVSLQCFVQYSGTDQRLLIDC